VPAYIDQSRSDLMEDLVSYIAKSLVNDPSQVTVRRRTTTTAVILELHVAPEDVGRVIGKDGRVANSIRALLKVADSQRRTRKRIILEIQ
jgi:hypothetical protein